MARTYSDTPEPRYVERAKHCDDPNSDYESLVKVMPTEIVLKDGKLFLAHDTQILTGQDGLALSSLATPVEITDVPDTAVNGTLTASQLATLQNNEAAYIMFNHEKFYLMDEGHTEGYLTYTHVGYDNGDTHIKTLTITLNTKAWVINDVNVQGK